ncbi:MAG: metalloregulator ArsR/SmtB family transcription factor [Chloroflexi bacterium]|nr:metalloregulator ArsR/SmtB family transcription factor [Chloroflexota bacterium]
MVDKNTEGNAALDSVFHALADPTRRSILRRLAGESMLVKDLAEPFDMSKQAVSKHLHVLEEAGLVVRIVEGRTTRVQLLTDRLRQVEDWVEFYRGFWTDGIEALARMVDGAIGDFEEPESPEHQENEQESDE